MSPVHNNTRTPSFLTVPLLRVISFIIILKFAYVLWITSYSHPSDFTTLQKAPHEIHTAPSQWRLSEPMGNARVVIEDTKHFDIDAAADWAAMAPGHGLVYIDGQPYTPSIFHQLRCLDVIRKAVYDLSLKNTTTPVVPTDLTRHCLSYMRQMITCRGDLEVDAILGKPGPNVYPLPYVCKDWTVVYRELEKNHASHFRKV